MTIIAILWTWSWSGVFFLTTLFLSWWVGWNIIGRPRRKEASLLTYPELLIGSGWFLLSLIIFVTGMLGLVYPVFLGSLWLLLLIGSVLDRKNWLESFTTSFSWHIKALSHMKSYRFAALVYILWFFLLLTFPLFHWDLLHYNYGLPAFWLGEHRIIPLAYDFYTYLHVPLRMHLLWGIALGCERIISWEIFFFILSSALIIMRIVHEFLQADIKWVYSSGLLFLSVPALWDDSLIQKDDPAIVWHGALLLLLYFVIRASFLPTLHFALVTGTIVASTFLQKSGVSIGYIGGLFILTALLFFKQNNVSGLKRYFVQTVSVFVIGLIPWLILLILGWGNPLALKFPYIGKVPLYSSDWRFFFEFTGTWHPSPFLEEIKNFLRYSIKLFRPYEWNIGAFHGFVILIALPLSLILPKNRQFTVWWGLTLIGCYFTFQLPRYLMILIPLETLLVFHVYSRLLSSRFFTRFIHLTFAIHIILLMTFLPYGVYATKTILSKFTKVSVMPFPSTSTTQICRYANKHLNPKKHRILFVGTTFFWPCRIPFEFQNQFFHHPLMRIERGTPVEETWKKVLLQRHITHIIFTYYKNAGYFDRFPLQDRFLKWLKKYGNPIFCASQPHEQTCLWSFQNL